MDILAQKLLKKMQKVDKWATNHSFSQLPLNLEHYAQSYEIKF